MVPSRLLLEVPSIGSALVPSTPASAPKSLGFGRCVPPHRSRSALAVSHRLDGLLRHHAASTVAARSRSWGSPRFRSVVACTGRRSSQASTPRPFPQRKHPSKNLPVRSTCRPHRPAPKSQPSRATAPSSPLLQVSTTLLPPRFRSDVHVDEFATRHSASRSCSASRSVTARVPLPAPARLCPPMGFCSPSDLQ